MDKITAPEIPKNHIEFAKAVAKAARDNGVDRFEMTYKPKFEQMLEISDNFYGDMKISFSAIDGRGRPDNRLSINLDTIYRINLSSAE